MRIERDHVARGLSRAGLSGDQRVRLVQTGIGRDAIVRPLGGEGGRTPGTLVILAGAAGGLAPGLDDAPPVGRVIDTHGGAWTPTAGAGPETGGGSVTVVGVDHIVEGPSDKRALHDRTGASIVDMESHAFADACTGLGIAWAIVRGVSDTPDQTLPAEVLGWIDPAGETRTLRAAADLLTRPRLIPHVAGVLRRSGRVLPRVGDRAAAIARHWLGEAR
jgi:hypothetical protein